MSNGKVVHVRGSLEYDVYVGRKMSRQSLDSIWGNPFKVKEHGLEAALKMYEWLIRGWVLEDAPDAETRRAVLLALRGKTLACWCAAKNGPPLTAEDPSICHGQVLHKLAEELTEER